MQNATSLMLDCFKDNIYLIHNEKYTKFSTCFSTTYVDKYYYLYTRIRIFFLHLKLVKKQISITNLHT